MVLRSGALPAGIKYLEERTVGPSLGSDSIRAGVTAAMIGLVKGIVTVPAGKDDAGRLLEFFTNDLKELNAVRFP